MITSSTVYLLLVIVFTGVNQTLLKMGANKSSEKNLLQRMLIPAHLRHIFCM